MAAVRERNNGVEKEGSLMYFLLSIHSVNCGKLRSKNFIESGYLTYDDNTEVYFSGNTLSLS